MWENTFFNKAAILSWLCTPSRAQFNFQWAVRFPMAWEQLLSFSPQDRCSIYLLQAHPHRPCVFFLPGVLFFLLQPLMTSASRGMKGWSLFPRLLVHKGLSSSSQDLTGTGWLFISALSPGVVLLARAEASGSLRLCTGWPVCPLCFQRCECTGLFWEPVGSKWYKYNFPCLEVSSWNCQLSVTWSSLPGHVASDLRVWVIQAKSLFCSCGFQQFRKTAGSVLFQQANIGWWWGFRSLWFYNTWVPESAERALACLSGGLKGGSWLKEEGCIRNVDTSELQAGSWPWSVFFCVCVCVPHTPHL